MTKLEKLRAKLATTEAPALLLTDITNVGWLTGFSGSSGYVLLTQSDALFLTDSRYAIQAGEEVKNMPNAWYSSPTTTAEFLSQQIAKMGLNRVGFESSTVTFDTYQDWKKKLPAVEFVPVGDIAGPLRMVKSADEVSKIQEACGVADACFKHIVGHIQPGVTEFDLCLDIEFFIRRQGAEIAFDPIVVSGPRSARPHGKPSEKKLESGDFLTMDFGAKVNGYNSDITRTVVVGEVTDRHREIYDLVLEAQLATIAMMKPGVAAKDVDAKAREIFATKDMAKYFGHGLGHGLGTIVHDTGRMNASSTDILEKGQVWTVEPGIYIDGFGGVRIEDDVVVTDSGVEILTHSQKDLMVLPS